MLLFIKKNKIKFIITFILLFSTSYYFLLNNNCLNLNRLVKSYIDFGYSNIKPCYVGSIKSLIKQKSPKLFTILSDINRHYFSSYNRDILDMNLIKNYNSRVIELFPEVHNIKVNNGIKGIINSDYETPKLEQKKINKKYISYVRQNKDNSNTKFYEKINLEKISNNNKPTLAWKHISIEPSSTKKKSWKRMV